MVDQLDLQPSQLADVVQLDEAFLEAVRPARKARREIIEQLKQARACLITTLGWVFAFSMRTGRNWAREWRAGEVVVGGWVGGCLYPLVPAHTLQNKHTLLN